MRDGGGRLRVFDDTAHVAVAAHADDSVDATITICPSWNPTVMNSKKIVFQYS